MQIQTSTLPHIDRDLPSASSGQGLLGKTEFKGSADELCSSCIGGAEAVFRGRWYIALGCGGAEAVCRPVGCPLRSGIRLPADVSAVPLVALSCRDVISACEPHLSDMTHLNTELAGRETGDLPAHTHL